MFALAELQHINGGRAAVAATGMLLAGEEREKEVWQLERNPKFSLYIVGINIKFSNLMNFMLVSWFRIGYNNFYTQTKTWFFGLQIFLELVPEDRRMQVLFF